MVKALTGTVLCGLLILARAALCQEPTAAAVMVSWSNSKTADGRSAFLVAPGESVTFIVQARGADRYQWAVDGAVQEGAEASSFTWTVPDRKGMWKVLAKATNAGRAQLVKREMETQPVKGWIQRLKGAEKERFLRDMADLNLHPIEARREWVVATHLTRVEPGESIQKAIDELPAEGGIVELAPGAHEVSDELYPPQVFRYAYKGGGYPEKPAGTGHSVACSILIQRSNVAVCGARTAVVRHHNNGISCFFIPDLVETDPRCRVENVSFMGFTTASAYSAPGGRGNVFILAHHVKNLTVDGLHDTSRASRFLIASAAPNETAKMLARSWAHA